MTQKQGFLPGIFENNGIFPVFTEQNLDFGHPRLGPAWDPLYSP